MHRDMLLTLQISVYEWTKQALGSKFNPILAGNWRPIRKQMATGPDHVASRKTFSTDRPTGRRSPPLQGPPARRRRRSCWSAGRRRRWFDVRTNSTRINSVDWRHGCAAATRRVHRILTDRAVDDCLQREITVTFRRASNCTNKGRPSPSPSPVSHRCRRAWSVTDSD